MAAIILGTHIGGTTFCPSWCEVKIMTSNKMVAKLIRIHRFNFQFPAKHKVKQNKCAEVTAD